MTDETSALTVCFTEFYYWVMIVLMFLNPRSVSAFTKSQFHATKTACIR